VNLGWPLLDDGAVVDIPHATVRPRDVDAEEGFGHQYDIGAPLPDFREQVYIHEAGAHRHASVTNKQRGLRVTLRFSETLPAVFEWKMTATQHYVLGLEPANTGEIGGRAAARAAGLLPSLEPGQAVSYRLSFEMERL
jgi:galactose mutarotase-like enzyme